MHLVTAEQGERQAIDDHSVCAALDGLPGPEAVHQWAQRFALLADITRLTLLLCIHNAGSICVTDLAIAAALKEATVSQALRLMRAHNLVTRVRDGRVIRYQLADEQVHDLLHRFSPPAVPPAADADRRANAAGPGAGARDAAR
jgi:DNA-binding transcriptional ArsR family regulator